MTTTANSFEAGFGGLAEHLDEHLKAHATGVGGYAWAVSVDHQVVTSASGWLRPDLRDGPMPADGVFRIASVSKPIVAVAALQLVDAGLAALDAPVDDVLPELTGRRVLVDPRSPPDGATVPAERSLTLRDLLSFRCGLGMEFDFSAPQPALEQMWEWGIGPGPTAPECGPDDFMERIGRLPLSDQPGTHWRYHTGSDIVSVYIERVRGAPLDAVLQRDIFEPLGMVDTGFSVRPDHVERLGDCRMPDDRGELSTWDGPDGRWSRPPAFRSGAAGLLSTTADLVAFGRMLLADGNGPKGRVLDATLASEMTTDQLTDQQRERARIEEGTAALGWGLGLAVRHAPAPSGWPSPGSYGWDGGLGSRWLVDPAIGLCAVILSTDAFTSAGAPALMSGFVDAIATFTTR